VKITVAAHAGYCYGVQRALTLAREAVASSKHPISTVGPIIHNPQVVARLADEGVREAACPADILDGTAIIRSHGVPPDLAADLKARGVDIVDATCPFVAKAQRCAADLARDGYVVVIVGEPEHPEVEAILGHAGGKDKAIVVESAADLPKWRRRAKVGVVVQTTQQPDRLREVVDALLPRAGMLKVCNTICNATAERQRAARQLAGQVDVMIVVGGKNSGNTRRLYELSLKRNPRTHHVETAGEIDPDWFAGAGSAGITGGASTPDWLLAEVVARVTKIAAP
jgi:(E)-4-hydroxy-3-methyl-but-2-enyl pyrophosphate reductase